MAPAFLHHSRDKAEEQKSLLDEYSEHVDLDQLWLGVIERCNKITDWNLEMQDNLSVDGILSRLKPPKGGSERKDAVQLVFKKTLICVQRFGELAANAASFVFGPAQVSASAPHTEEFSF
jgi:hypothetical protein